MICPYCQHETAELWQPMFVVTDEKGQSEDQPRPSAGLLVDEDDAVVAICEDAGIDRKERLTKRIDSVGLLLEARWMQCPNVQCRQLLLHAKRRVYDPTSRGGRSVLSGKADDLLVEETVVFPTRRIVRPIDPLIPARFAVPFKQGCLILEDSPGMSAVLSRKVLADLLEKYAGCAGYTVKDQIDKFIADPQQPSALKENLHYLREMADFAAHTKTDLTTGEILDTTPEEASWTLDVIDGLFDYFIIGPTKDATRRAEMAKKMDQAGRKPIPPRDQEGNP